MLKVEVDIGIRPATIPLIARLKVVDFRLFKEILLSVMGELEIGPIPVTIPPK